MGVKLSVVIPVYNAERYLPKCLESVLSQSLRDIEVLCVDDGSTDGSRAYLESCAARDGRLRILPQENAGPGAARNRGFDEASGKYILFLDADDWFEPDMFFSMVESAERNGADVVVCRTQCFDSDTGAALNSAWMLKEELLPGEAFSPAEAADHFFQFTYGMVWDKLYRSAFLRERGIRFPPLRCGEDTAFAFQTLLSASRISVVPTVGVHYRVNRQGSVSNSFARQPEAPFLAFESVYDFLNAREDRGLFKRSFLNWALEYLPWQVNNMPDAKIRRDYHRLCSTRWFPELKLSSYPASFWVDRAAYLRYRLVCLPYPVYDPILRLYKFSKGKKGVS